MSKCAWGVAFGPRPMCDFTAALTLLQTLLPWLGEAACAASGAVSRGAKPTFRLHRKAVSLVHCTHDRQLSNASGRKWPAPEAQPALFEVHEGLLAQLPSLSLAQCNLGTGRGGRHLPDREIGDLSEGSNESCRDTARLATAARIASVND